MNANIGDILNMPLSDVKFPKLPAGTYVGVVMGLPVYGESSKKKTKFVEFQIKLFESMDDVDPDELEEFGSIADTQMPLTFYYATEGGKNRLVKFIEDCGIDTSDGRSIVQYAEDLSGKTVGVVVKHEMNENGSRAKLDGTVAVQQ